MEKDFKEIPVPQEEEAASRYTPRPLWQIAGAWLGLVLFVAVVFGFYIILAKGGM